MQYTIAISDAVLALACAWAIVRLYPRFVLSAVPGFGLVGAAALLGVLRYALFPELKAAHGLVSTMAGWIGMPLLGFAFVLVGWRYFSSRIQLSVLFLLAIAFVVFRFAVDFPLYGIVVGGLAMVLVLATGLKQLGKDVAFAGAAIAGAVLVIFVGLVVRGDGQWAGVLRVNWYHYGLAAAMFCLGFALNRSSGSK